MDEMIHIDVRTCELTLSEALREIERLKAEYPEREFFLDGDSHSVMSRPRAEVYMAVRV